MAKATALARARRVKQRPKPKPQSAQIGPDGPKHPDNRQLYNKRGCPDAGARLHADYPKPKVATFCAALWLTFTLPLTAVTTVPAGWMIWQGYHMGARKRTLTRMGLNTGIDLVVGGIPLVGDIFDVAFKSHKKNLALLKNDMQRKIIQADSDKIAQGRVSQTNART